jgi:stigma-specific protein Stig1
MTYQWDEFSKSLADDSLPRRESLRWLGAALAGAVLSPFGLREAWGAPKQDPCKAFCGCSNKTQQNQCLAACQACNGNTSRLGGACGNYTCCAKAVCNGACSDLSSNPNCGACGNDCRDFSETCCGTYCADLKNDFQNCGSCGFRCPDPGPFEFGECIAGGCHYACVEGAVKCNSACSVLDSDPNNCGACGNVCPGPNPHCIAGVCGSCPDGSENCGGGCVDILFDGNNCGACGHVCQPLEFCSWGNCEGSDGGYGY